MSQKASEVPSQAEGVKIGASKRNANPLLVEKLVDRAHDLGANLSQNAPPTDANLASDPKMSILHQKLDATWSFGVIG